jgi:hypothetical protein
METMDEGERLHAEVEALKIAVTFIARALPPAKRKLAQEHATVFCERLSELLEATTTTDAQLRQMKLTVAAVLGVETQTPE